MTDSFAKWHAERLREFLTETTPDPMNVRAIARELNVLPLLSDWNGCFALQPNGEIILFLYDNYRDIKPERDARIRNIALFQGSKKYPELAPPRPPNAKPCSHCGGNGIEPFSAKRGISNVSCYCGGLGWLSPES